jgi:CheY-like chemotaxis protein
VLVIEDDSDLRESLADVLREHGRSVLAVTGGKEAIRYLEGAAKLPRLVLLDLHMPNGDGLHFRQHQVKRAGWAAIPVLIMTGDVDVLDKVASLRAAGYVRKPVDIPVLVEMVDRLLG